uniref:Protein YIPF n=1 Tax=Plectus sambesii TaxID=2011161 RepID=A0A914WAJ6_9BILA
MSSYWMDDQNNSGGDWTAGNQGQASNDGWASFDYTQPSAPIQQPQQQSYYSQAQSTVNSGYGGNMFNPAQQTMGASGGESVNFEDELPLLEELGINFDHIRQKTVAVLNPVGTTSAEVIADQDLAGPLVFCLLFGGALLLHGKVQFGFIYGIGVVGCLGMYALLNMMAAGGISLTCTVSVLGYCLLPMALLSLLAAGLTLQGMVGYIISIMAVLWCSLSSSKLFVTTCAMDSQQLLVAYPCFLVYGVFALLAIF